jgi:hypothetical protein
MSWQYYLVVVIKLKTYNVYGLQKWIRPFMRCDLEEDEYREEDQPGFQRCPS